MTTKDKIRYNEAAAQLKSALSNLAWTAEQGNAEKHLLQHANIGLSVLLSASNGYLSQPDGVNNAVVVAAAKEVCEREKLRFANDNLSKPAETIAQARRLNRVYSALSDLLNIKLPSEKPEQKITFEF